MERIVIIGAGYVGLVTGACLAELGHCVTCVEIDPARLSALRQAKCPIHEPDLPRLIARNMRQGRLRFTDCYAETIPSASIVFLTVPTPSAPNGQVDTSYVFAAAQSVFDYAAPGLIVTTKSTVPVGTSDALETLARRHGIADIAIAANPEFLREGSAVADFMRPDRVVIGADTQEIFDRLAALYANLDAPIISCSRRSAELGKYASNAFLAAKISFMNEMAAICERSGADILEIKTIVGGDRRIGPAFLGAGVGWGGSCFPKDVRGLAATALEAGCDTPMLDAVTAINARQRERAFDVLRRAACMYRGPTVGVLGLAFKPHTDDVRESPALDIIGRLLEEGIRVRAHDP